ncbi:hypothetical protein EI94DRAFT_1697288 [Lactarius quietus]|nr:hypothetical protein EI94DRAFT_1697288 [Lactarius quietus]
MPSQAACTLARMKRRQGRRRRRHKKDGNSGPASSTIHPLCLLIEAQMLAVVCFVPATTSLPTFNAVQGKTPTPFSILTAEPQYSIYHTVYSVTLFVFTYYTAMHGHSPAPLD